MPYATIQVEALTLYVKLGVTVEEQHDPQPVSVSWKWHLPTLLPLFSTDTLPPAFCYHFQIEQIRDYCATKTFHLIETLAYRLYTLLQALLPKEALLTLTARKLHPPIPAFTGSVSCTIGEIP